MVNAVAGYRFASIVPVAFVFIAMYKQIKVFRLDLVVAGAFLTSLPMLTPLATDLAGFQHFTMLNYDLQGNPALKVAAVLLISLFVASYFLGAKLHREPREAKSKAIVKIDLLVICFLFAVIFGLLIKYLRSDTVLYEGYGTVYANASSVNSTVNQLFNGFVAFCLTYLGSRNRRRIVVFIYVCVIILAFLVARRTLAIGTLMLLMYTLGGKRFTPIQIASLVFAVFLLWFIGIARSVGIINYISSAKVAAAAAFFALPGGASNLFVGSMGVIDLVNSGRLRGSDTFPILSWASGHLEGQIYQSKAYPPESGTHHIWC